MIIVKKHVDQEKNALKHSLVKFLDLDIDDFELFHLYQLNDPDAEKRFKDSFFDLNKVSFEESLPKHAFRIKDNDGQYNQTQDLTQKYIDKVLALDAEVRYSKAYAFDLDQDDLDKLKAYLINPVVEKEVSLDYQNFEYAQSDHAEHQPIEGFNSFDDSQMTLLQKDYGLDLDDLFFIQSYFKKEGRDPKITELKMLDTYWSDHCRHTTFLTELSDIKVEEGRFKQPIDAALKLYQDTRQDIYKDNERPVTLMDLATINQRELKQKGIVTDIEKSSEVNACSVEVEIEVGGKQETWLHMFKNETHNHPTEIEPYGGAHTCIGGAIRDPLSGRARVFQGIRIVGAGNPLTPHDQTMENKLAQYYISNLAMQGFSDYGNQIGAPVGLIHEYYNQGFLAKRMEVGALVAANKKEYVRREEAKAGDIILLLGAPTGRDGLGAAVGSSSVQTQESLTKAGAQVQKGNPYAEKKIMRLFDNPQASKLIKKSNDFGAGGVSVAIGELADGLVIDLDAVHTKYPGMNGYEIALSESQERMAVVLDPKDVDLFMDLARQEDLEVTKVAEVSDDNRLKMYFKDELIIDLSRDLLDSNGAKKEMPVIIETDQKSVVQEYELDFLNQALASALSQYFDQSLGRNKVFAEYGGKYQATKQRGIVSRFRALDTKAVSVMTYGYYPEIGQASAFHAGYYGVLQSIAANVAITGNLDKIRLSLQEYFPSIQDDPRRMGLPTAALLGAFNVMKALDIPAIGGKDSMSGSFQEIDVPPSLISFAVNSSTTDRVVSREFKAEDSQLVMTKVKLDEYGLIDLDDYKRTLQAFEKLHEEGKILAASDMSTNGLKASLEEMLLGNGLGLRLFRSDDSFVPGAIVFETSKELELDDKYFEVIGQTTRFINMSSLVDFKKELLTMVYEDITINENFEDYEFVDQNLAPLSLNNKQVVIPVLEGSTGEDDLAMAFEAEGFEVTQVVIGLETPQAYQASLDRLLELIEDSQVFALAHGDYLGSVYKNAAGLLTDLLLNDKIKNALADLHARDGFILGVGQGFAGLIDAGYFGGIKDNLSFVENKNNRYIHMIRDFEVVASSYVSNDENRYYSAPVSGKSITLQVKDEKVLENDITVIARKMNKRLPGESSIEAITSKDGRIIGISSLVERMDKDLFKNIELVGLPNYFKQLRKNFKEAQ